MGRYRLCCTDRACPKQMVLGFEVDIIVALCVLRLTGRFYYREIPCCISGRYNVVRRDCREG